MVFMMGIVEWGWAEDKGKLCPKTDFFDNETLVHQTKTQPDLCLMTIACTIRVMILVG